MQGIRFTTRRIRVKISSGRSLGWYRAAGWTWLKSDGFSAGRQASNCANGQPADKAILPTWMPAKLGRKLAQRMIKKQLGRMEDYGLPKPDHEPLEGHPSVSGEFLTRVGCGDITPKGAIDRRDSRVWV